MRAVESASLALVATMLACAGGTPPVISPEPKPSNATEVVIFNYTYKPLTMTVPVGTTVTWINKDLAPHTVTHRSYDRDNFDSGNMLNAQKYQRTFRRAGTFDYICSLHQGMQGSVVVTKDSAAAH